MNCPYCSNIMEMGLIEGDGRRALTWKAKRECEGFIEKVEDFFNSYDEMLSDSFSLWKTHIHCHRCSACEKIIIDLKEIRPD